MRLLLSASVLLGLASVASAEPLVRPAPGAPAATDAMFSSFAEAVANAPAPPAQCLREGGANICMSTAFAATITEPDGKRLTKWFVGDWAPQSELLCFSITGGPDLETYGEPMPCDDPRAARVLQRVLAPPDIGPP